MKVKMEEGMQKKKHPLLTRGEMVWVMILTGILLVGIGICQVKRLRRVNNPVVFHPAQQGEPRHYLIDLNTAPAEELQLLPGIGEQRARQIVELRQKMGRLTSLDDLRQIKGIDEKLVRGMAEYVTLQGRPQRQGDTEGKQDSMPNDVNLNE